MNIQSLIKTIQTDTTNGQGNIAPEIMDAVTGLVSRLEGMLPDIESARGVAQKLGLTWEHEPTSATLAWARVVWPLYEAGQIGEILPVVLPLLPAGQPFGQSEFDHVYGEVLIAEMEGNQTTAAMARGKGRAMRAHNWKGGFTRPTAPADPPPVSFSREP